MRATHHRRRRRRHHQFVLFRIPIQLVVFIFLCIVARQQWAERVERTNNLDVFSVVAAADANAKYMISSVAMRTIRWWLRLIPQLCAQIKFFKGNAI